MAGNVPFILGPVQTGSSFMIVSIQNSQPFLLNSFPFNNGILYYWESNFTSIVSQGAFPVFSAEGTLDSLTITDTINTGGIAFRSDGITLGNAGVPAQIKMSQPLYANWFPPDIFLSRVVYTFANSANQTANILTTTSATGPTISANNIIILPVIWYFNCTNSGSYFNINQPIDSVINWFCLVNSNLTGCSQFNITTSGWTNLSDCTVGNNYNYCPQGEICGTDNCNGPCSVIYDDCNFVSNNYVCEFDPSKFFSDTQWWESPYFIGGVFGIVILIIILIVISYSFSRQTKNLSNF